MTKVAGNTNVHDNGLSPSVMKALATEKRRKSFLTYPWLCARVAIYFHGKKQAYRRWHNQLNFNQVRKVFSENLSSHGNRSI